jgi:hypothetical protein
MFVVVFLLPLMWVVFPMVSVFPVSVNFLEEWD